MLPVSAARLAGGSDAASDAASVVASVVVSAEVAGVDAGGWAGSSRPSRVLEPANERLMARKGVY